MEFSFPFDSVETDGIDDRVYFASDFRRYFAQFISNGVYPNPSNGLKVESLNNSMVLTVNLGSAYMNGICYALEEEPLLMRISDAHMVYNRKDSIVVQADETARTAILVYHEGKATANPKAPEIVRNADTYELKLCEITVKSATQGISQADILDTRLDGAVCGIVTAVVDSVDTTELFSQYDVYLKEKIAEWNKFQEKEQAVWTEQMEQQQEEFEEQQTDFNVQHDTQKNAFGAWFDGAKLDIANLQYYDFDNLLYMSGYTRESVKTKNPTTWTERFINDADGTVFATRISVKDDITKSWTETITCEKLLVNIKIISSKDENGKWTEVVSNG